MARSILCHEAVRYVKNFLVIVPLLRCLCWFPILTGNAQTLEPPAVEWQKSLGGKWSDFLYSVQALPDGGFLVAGDSNSDTNGRTAPIWGGDFWIVRLDAQGNQLWDKSFGGTGSETCMAIQPALDGGFLLGGYSGSEPGGNKTSPFFGGDPYLENDFWIIRTTPEGVPLWDQSFGGTNMDMLTTIQRTTNGGFILGGTTASGISGNKTTAGFGSYDWHVVRIDPDGTKLWERTFGTTSSDWLKSIVVTADGGFLLGGDGIAFTNGNKTALGYGMNDFWVIRLDADGHTLWERCFGGSNNDHLFCLAALPDGGFLAGGLSTSDISGNKTSPNYGGDDYWIVRLDEMGNKLWERSYGGDASDQLIRVQQTADGGFIVAGRSGSGVSGNKTSSNYGGYDYWMLRLNAEGNVLWEQTYGGSSQDSLQDIQLTGEGGFILGGYSHSSISGNKTSANVGNADYWVVKLEPDELSRLPRLRSTSVNPSSSMTNEATFSILGLPNFSYAIEFSTNLTEWISVQTNQQFGEKVEFSEPAATTAKRRFYRARWVP